MRRLLVIAALLLFAGIAFGQTLKKGAVVVINTWEVTLQPDATFNQALDLTKKYAATFEKAYPGTNMFVMKGDRGEYKYKICTLIFFDSVELRDKYWPTEEGAGPFEKQLLNYLPRYLKRATKL